MVDQIPFIVFLPIIFSIVVIAVSRLSGRAAAYISALVSGVTLLFTLDLYSYAQTGTEYSIGWAQSLGFNLYFFADRLNIFMVIAASALSTLAIIYSFRYITSKDRPGLFYFFTLLTLGAVNGALLSNSLLILAIFWEIATISFVALILLGKYGDPRHAAYKTLLILVASDLCLIFGVITIFVSTNTLNITTIGSLTGPYFVMGFILFLIGAAAKAAAIPLHTWLPEAAAVAPTPVIAMIPAALDKFLGIYLLTRISYQLFLATNLGLLVSVIGTVTMLLAVMMALIQKDLKKLLSFHAISQVGYMFLGIGLGTPWGLVGGLFHMLNHSIYKMCLFLTGGAIQYRTGTKDLEKLGGLAKYMPVTAISAVVAAMSISGVPPFNGFASKWIIYTATLDVATTTNPSYMLFTVVAMLASALTLASFIKYLHGAFFGGAKLESNKEIKEVPWSMQIPMILLAALCIIFGLFPQIPLGYLIFPAVNLLSSSTFSVTDSLTIYGPTLSSWTPVVGSILLGVGLVVGLLFYLAGSRVIVKPPVEVAWSREPFIGGEDVAPRYSAPQFYPPVKSVFKPLYHAGEKMGFDAIYRTLYWIPVNASKGLSRLQVGMLQLYLAAIAVFIVTAVLLILWI